MHGVRRHPAPFRVVGGSSGIPAPGHAACQPHALSIPVPALTSALPADFFFFFFLSSLLDGAVVKALNNSLHLSGARQPASWRQISLLIHFQGS